MAAIVELRDAGEARRFLLQGLWRQQVVPPRPDRVRAIFEWCLEIAASGFPLPPVGFVADVGHFIEDPPSSLRRSGVGARGDWPAVLTRSYEDFVLGKLDSDWSFERAAAAIRGFSGRDRCRGLAYVIRQVRDRAGLGGIELPPAILRGLLQQPAEVLLAEGYESLSQSGAMPLLVTQYEDLIRGFRRLGDLMAPEDVRALEQRTALADMGQYVAHRQLLQTWALLESRLPTQPVRPTSGRREVPTRVIEANQYPVGGYASIANRGSLESLLHSQLAYMEPESPDLFDFKFVRNELFYYSRDENQFFRRRRTIVFLLDSTLALTRYKDRELPVQRIVFVLAVIVTLIRKLTDWWSTVALRFEIVILNRESESTLEHERELLSLVLQDEVARNLGGIHLSSSVAEVERLLTSWANACPWQGLRISSEAYETLSGSESILYLDVSRALPRLFDSEGRELQPAADEPVACWVAAVEQILGQWI